VDLKLKMINKFKDPIYVTRPLMPDLDLVMSKFKDVWESQWLSNGGMQHKALESQVCEFLKTKQLSLFNNGTIALLVAVQSLRLQGEVITTPFTFPATTHVLAWNNIKPVFCDIDPKTLTINPEHIESLITNRTTGILGVHVYGMPCHVDRIQEIADRHGLRVIYDAAHAFGTEINGSGIGTFGDISMFSFHPTKLFHTAEGGALTYNDHNLKQRIDLLKNFGIRNEFEVIMPGINGKMNELSAVIGLIVLDMVKDEWKRRQAIREQYTRELNNIPGVTFFEMPEGITNSQQYMVIRVNGNEFGKTRDEVYAHLRDHNVYARKYFYPLTSDFPCYHQLPSARDGSLINAKQASEEVLCLPFYGALDHEQVTSICDLIIS
jgi:dTDP-4-amino-4,6-dideoxygalactose transaminase